MNIAEKPQTELPWRKRPNNEHAEDVGDVSPHKIPRCIKSPIFVTLAEESPMPNYDSDSESIYDSLNGRETDFCRDTSDTESYTTDGIATMDVLEYDVASTSASEVLYSNDSSSGTDDYVVAAVAHAIFDSSSSDELREILSESDDFDGPSDTELGRADYWTCVKCKNRQNNPMYRFCEKCYQIRKTHFPPRPKLRKTRSRTKKHSSRGISSTDEKTKKNKKKNKFSKLRNSAGESGSSGISDENDGNDLDLVKKNDCPKSDFKIKNKLFKNVVDIGQTSQLQLDLLNPPSVRKDSGFSSCSSIQDLSPDMGIGKDFPSSQETFCSEYEESKNRVSLHTDTANTITDSIDVITPITSQSSTISEASTSSMSSGILSFPSCSEPILFHKNLAELTDRVVNKRRSYSDTEEQSNGIKSKSINGSDLYGSCMMCLNQPKNGVFVHSRSLHLCCCYRCAVKVWNKTKRCPICNCKVKNVMKLFVH